MDASLPKVLLSHNRRLSGPEIARATAVVERVKALQEGRSAYVAERQLDPEFCLPGGNFLADTGVTGRFRRVGQHLLDYPEHFNRLRFFSMNFSGFSLLHNERCHGKAYMADEALTVSDAEADERLGRLLTRDGPHALWEYLRDLTPADALFTPPPICGEVGLDVSGIIVNADTAVYQERISLLHHLGLLRFLQDKIAERGVARVLEIGAGYGAVARHIKQTLHNVSYTICDLPEAMYFSAPYLALALPDLETRFATGPEADLEFLGAMHFLPNYALPPMAASARFDLVINTLSMSEFSAHQAHTYGGLISKMIGGTGMFFEQNFDNTESGMINCKAYLPTHFLRRTQIGQPPFMTTQGPVDVWSNRSLRLPYKSPAPVSA